MLGTTRVLGFANNPMGDVGVALRGVCWICAGLEVRRLWCGASGAAPLVRRAAAGCRAFPGHAVNPSMEARMRHPCRLRSRKGPAPDGPTGPRRRIEKRDAMQDAVA